MKEEFNITEAAEILCLNNKDMLRVYAQRYGLGIKKGSQWSFSEEDIKQINIKRKKPVLLHFNQEKKEDSEKHNCIEIERLFNYVKNQINLCCGTNDSNKEKWFFEGKISAYKSIFNFLKDVEGAGDWYLKRQRIKELTDLI